MKKIFLSILLFIFAIGNNVLAEEYGDNYNESAYCISGNQFLQNSQYSSAIAEFKKALRENPADLSSKIGITNAYISRAQYYNNKSFEYQKAANDLRSALFYMKYYDEMSSDPNITQACTAAEQNLNTVLSNLNADRSSKARYTAAKNLRSQGEFAASAYEFYQLINDKTYRKDAYIGIADVMKILCLPQKAVFYYERAVQLDQKNADLHLKLARAYEQVGNSDGAASEYNLALQNSAEKEDILLALQKIWEQKVSANNQDAEAHANLGVVYQKQGNLAAAMDQYKQAEAINPTNITTRLNLATLYQAQKNYDGAIAAYNSVIQLYPNHVPAHIYKAQCLKQLGHNEDAIREYKLAMGYDPTNSQAREELFELLKATMPAEQILAYLYQNVQNQPLDPNLYYEFAYELHKANKLDDAITYYDQTIKLDPNKIDSYINLSQVYRQKNNLTQALATIENAKRLFPNDAGVQKQYNSITEEMSSTMYTSASALFEKGQYSQAITAYNKIQPATTESLLGIAACYQALENYKSAIYFYRKALESDPNSQDIPYYLGSAYLSNNDYANAKIYLNKAIALDKTNEKAKNLLKFALEQENNDQLEKALNLYDQKKYLEALKIVNAVLLKDPQNGGAYYYRGLIYDAQSKYNLAITDYQNAIKFSPDITLAHYSLAVDYDSVGRYKDAAVEYKKFLATKPEESEYTKYARKRITEIK